MKFSKSLVAVSALTFLASCGNNNQPNTPTVTETTTVTTETTTTPTTTTQTTTSTAVTEKKEVVSYNVPSGEIKVEFDLDFDANGNIVDAGADLVFKPEGDQVTENMVENFDEAIDNVVVGKKIADIQALNAVGGASLTTDAFKKFAANIQ